MTSVQEIRSAVEEAERWQEMGVLYSYQIEARKRRLTVIVSVWLRFLLDELDEKDTALTLIADIAYDLDGNLSAEKLYALIAEIYCYASCPEKASMLLKEKES